MNKRIAPKFEKGFPLCSGTDCSWFGHPDKGQCSFSAKMWGGLCLPAYQNKVEDLERRIDEFNEAGRGFEELCEVLKNQIETYCGDFCEKRPMQEGCEVCPFYDEDQVIQDVGDV